MANTYTVVKDDNTGEITRLKVIFKDLTSMSMEFDAFFEYTDYGYAETINISNGDVLFMG